MTISEANWMKMIKWDHQGLIPAIAQDVTTHRVLMMAWMNKLALQETIATGQAVYWSRSRQKLWHKGEESGHTQHIVEIRLDCDADVLLLMVQQSGQIACHTGRLSCFYRVFKEGEWQELDPILKSPEEIYQRE